MRKRRNIGGDITLCHNMANAFLDIGTYSNELDKQAQSSSILFMHDAFYGIPAIVNIAFACELYLKALILRNSDQPVEQKHELFELYQSLPPHLRDDLAKRFTNRCKYPVTLKETLELHTQAFKTWRYVYEPENNNAFAYPDNLLLVAEILKDELEQKPLKREVDT